jgi:cysteine desulfurase
VTIYLDHAATSPLRPEALEAMLPYLTSEQGNPSSPHAAGRRARMALDEARERLAQGLGAEPRELVFTSGGTEAINLAVKGAAWAGKAMGHRVLCTGVEHRAVLGACSHLETFGFEIVRLPVDRYGRLDPDALTAALSERTILVSLQLANSEVGTVAHLGELVSRVRGGSRALVHVDAVQAAPWMRLDVRALDVDLLSIAGHKLGGPKGSGVLWLRRGTAILPQVHGGSQERYRRAGTEDVAGAVGMSVAHDMAMADLDSAVDRVRALRDRLRDAIVTVHGVEVSGHPADRLPGHLSIIVRGVDGHALVMALDLDGLACSTGSACTTGSTEPSHVLTAMGYPPDEARGALRLSLGRPTRDEDVEAAQRLVPAAIARLREGEARLAALGVEAAARTGTDGP